MSHCAGKGKLCCTVTRAPRKWSSARRYDHDSRDPEPVPQLRPDPAPTLTPIPVPTPTPTSSPGAQDAELVDFFRILRRNQSRTDTDCDCDTDSDPDSEGYPRTLPPLEPLASNYDLREVTARVTVWVCA